MSMSPLYSASVPVFSRGLNALSPETAEHTSQRHAYAFSSGMFGVLNDDVLDVTGRPPVSFAVGVAAAWRR